MAAALKHFAVSEAYEPKRLARTVADVRRALLIEPGLAELEPNGHAIRFVLRKFCVGKRLQNIRSSVRAMLRWLHDEFPSTRTSTPLSSSWTAVLMNLTTSRNQRLSLTRFARFCSARNLKPGDVTDAHVGLFQSHVANIGTVKDPRKLIRQLIRAWNACANTVEGWPDISLRPLDRIGLPQQTPRIDQIDPRLADEITGCLLGLAGGDRAQPTQSKRFDRRRPEEGGPQPTQKTLKDSTIVSYGKYLRRAVRILSDVSSRSLSNIHLREVVEPAMAEAIMNALSDELTASGSGERSLQLMSCTLLCAAEHYFRVNAEDLATLRWLGEQVDRPEPTMTEKNIARLHGLVITKRHELMRLPSHLLSRTIRLIKEGRHQERHLVDAQVAVAIAVLISIPIRAGNIAAIRLGKHLNLPMQPGTDGRLQIPAEMVKNNVPIDRRVPLDVAELMRAYVRIVLPMIRSNPESTALFPGRKDNSTRGPAHLGTQVSRRIAEHLGIKMNMHLFRHFAAVMYLEEHPGEYEVVRLLLGNRNLDTVKSYYTSPEKEAAVAKAGTVIAAQKVRAGLNPNNMLQIVSTARMAGRRKGRRRA